MCEHDWKWSYDCFEDARIISGDQLGIPVKCTKCGAEGIEWYVYSQVEIKKEEKTRDCYTLSEGTKKEIADARAEIKAGRFYTLAEVKKELGL